MPIQFTITDNIPDAIKGMQIVRDRLPVMAQRTVNDAAFYMQGEIRRETQRIFDRPTPFVQRRWKVTRAKKSPEPVARLDPPRGTEDVLRHHVFGGHRRGTVEGFFSADNTIDRDIQLVPTNQAKKNVYGNVSVKEWRRLSEDLAGRGKKGVRRTFYGRPSPKSPLGIYEGRGKNDKSYLALLAIAVPPGYYRRRFNLYRLADRRLKTARWRTLFRPHLLRTIEKIQEASRGR